VAGGAIFPVLMGLTSDLTGTQVGGLSVLFVALGYLLFSAVRIK